MKNVRTNLLLLSFISSTLFMLSCRNGAPRPIKPQSGKAQAVQDTSLNQQSFDEAISSDKTIQCKAGFEKKYNDLMSKAESANKILSDNLNKDLDTATQTDLLKRSVELMALSDALLADMITQKASACTLSSDQGSQSSDSSNQDTSKANANVDKVSISDSYKFKITQIKNTVDKTIIAISDKTKVENETSKKARAEKVKTDQARSKNSMVGVIFQVSKKLADVFDSSHLNGEAHFVQGVIGMGKTDYTLLLKDKSKTVCEINSVSGQKILVDTKLTVLNVSIAQNEEVDPSDETSVVKSANLIVNVGTNNNLYTLSCRLADNYQTSSKEAEFKGAFKDLIQVQN